MPKYENSNTKDIVEYERPNARLEMLPNWKRLDPELESPKEPEEESPSAPANRPAKNATKDAWQAYARTRAQDPFEAAAIDDLTKDQLIEQYGGTDN